MGVTERLARVSSRHPWRTIGAWVVALVLAFACIAVLLPGNLTSEGGAAGNPEFRRAERTEAASLPFNPRLNFSDLILISSSRYTVDQPAFRAFVALPPANAVSPRGLPGGGGDFAPIGEGSHA